MRSTEKISAPQRALVTSEHAENGSSGPSKGGVDRAVAVHFGCQRFRDGIRQRNLKEIPGTSERGHEFSFFQKQDHPVRIRPRLRCHAVQRVKCRLRGFSGPWHGNDKMIPAGCFKRNDLLSDPLNTRITALQAERDIRSDADRQFHQLLR